MEWSKETQEIIETAEIREALKKAFVSWKDILIKKSDEKT
jgi:hypothetical protein